MTPRKNNKQEEDLASMDLPTDDAPVASVPPQDEPAAEAVDPKDEAGMVGELDPAKLEAERKEELAKVSAKIGSKEYEFPYNDPEDIRIALYLSQYFQRENLINGQILTFNFHREQMTFLPDLDLELNMDNPSFTYHDQTFHDFQADIIVDLVKRQELLLGDYGVKRKQVKKMDMSNTDFKVMLDKPERQIFQDIKALAQESTHVDPKSGEVKSPVPVLKAMYEFERTHKSRKKVLKMIDRALNHIGGSVQFLDKMTDIAPAGTTADNPQSAAVQERVMTANPTSDDF